MKREWKIPKEGWSWSGEKPDPGSLLVHMLGASSDLGKATVNNSTKEAEFHSSFLGFLSSEFYISHPELNPALIEFPNK